MKLTTIYRKFKSAHDRWAINETWKTQGEIAELKAYKYMRLIMQAEHEKVSPYLCAKKLIQEAISIEAAAELWDDEWRRLEAHQQNL